MMKSLITNNSVSLLCPALSFFFTLSVFWMGSFSVNASQDLIGQGIQLLQKGQLIQAKEKLRQIGKPLTGEALFLAARIAESEQDWPLSMTLYRGYLSSNPFSVHRLEARAAFALLRAYRNDPLLGEFLKLVQLRDLNQIKQMQSISARMYARHPNASLAIKGLLLTAYSLLESAQQPKSALQIYLSIAKDTKDFDADLHIQALFGATFAAIRLNKLTESQIYMTQIQRKLDSKWGRNNSLLARSWQQRVDAMKFILPLAKQNLTTNEPFLWGVGARLLLDNPIGSGQHFTPIWQTLSQEKLNVKSVTLWITQESDWNWLHADLLRGAHSYGYIPMINYWFFGDQISPKYVTENRERYLDEVKNKLVPLLRNLPQAYLILEPEFNKQGIETWDQWDPLMLEVIRIVREGAPQVKVGLGLGDWDQPGASPSYASAEKAIEASDFIASMLMLSSYTERAHASPDWSAWVRALRLGERLQQRFNKPWMLAYLSIASQPSWEQQQAIEIQKLEFYLPMLRNLGLFALNWFSLTDEPQQAGWFAEAEKSFGLLDSRYHPKPAFEDYKRLVERHNKEQYMPNVRSFQATLNADSELVVQAKFDHWANWKLTIQQNHKTWQQKGVGDSFSVKWHGQMLPEWAVKGELSITLTVNGMINKTLNSHWNHSIQHHSFPITETVSLSKWQSWQTTSSQTLTSAQLNQQNNGSFELVLEQLKPTQLNTLQIGIIDQFGFQQTLSAASYAYQINGMTALYVPLTDFNRSWVKFIDGKPLWIDHPRGPISVIIQNHGMETVLFDVNVLNIRTR